VFRSISLRLAALYTVLFALAVAVLGAVILFATRAALAQQFEARITSETGALVQEFHTEGLNGVVQAVHERDNTPGALDYGLKGPEGVPLAGRLAAVQAPLGWSVATVPARRGPPEPVRLLSTDLPGGYRLLVGDDLERIEALDGVVLRGFAVALLGVVLLGAAGGYGLSRDMQRRFTAISDVAEAIIDGDLARRVPLRGEADDLDRLAATFNRMLDRIAQLMESLRQVSNDIAHDLRTPLTRLRQRLEAGLRTTDAQGRGEAMEAALADLDAILETFAGLLRISEIEGGARRAAFRRLDLAATARLVVEGFAPSAEESGRSLTLVADGPIMVEGDAELLAQLLVNLVENGLRHTPAGSRIRVVAGMGETGPLLSVIDDGPGVGVAEQERLFDRFYRLERSRSTPGSGLGLALVAAVAKLHGARIVLADAGPGLEARVAFPNPA
jgi:signal transduction histidine kinase